MTECAGSEISGGGAVDGAGTIGGSAAPRQGSGRRGTVANHTSFAIEIGSIVALALALTTPALAQEDDRFNHPTASVILTGVLGVATFSDLGPLDVENPASLGFNARINYRFTRWVSAEAQFEWIDGWDLEEGSTDLYEISRIVSGSANLKGYFLTNRWQPYGLVGVGATQMRRQSVDTGDTYSKTDFAMRFGAGVDYFVTDGLGLNLESVFVQPFGEWTDYHYLTINWGIILRF